MPGQVAAYCPSRGRIDQHLTVARHRLAVAAMSTLEIIIVFSLTAAGAIVHGSIGIGLGLVAAPALVAIDPAFAPGPLLIVAQIIGVRHLTAERHEADFDAWKRGMIGVPFGVVAAIVLLEVLSDKWLAIIVGSLTAIAAAMLLSGFELQRGPRAEIAAGGGCAFASLTAALPGPPLVCVYSDMKPSTMRPTASMLIMSVAIIGFFSLLFSGNFGGHEVKLLGYLVPGVLAGLFAARWVRPHLDRPWFRPMVLVIALVGGLGLVARQLL